MPLPSVRRIWGAAYRKRRGTPFYITISPFFTALSTSPNREGRRLIAHFTRILGEPTLHYRDRREEVDDYTAEWHLLTDREAIMQRILNHMALGFTPEELPWT